MTGWLDPALTVLRPILLDLYVLSCPASVSCALRLVHHSYRPMHLPVHQLFLTSSCMLACACDVHLFLALLCPSSSQQHRQCWLR